MFQENSIEPVYYLGWNRSPAQVGGMRQALGPGALGKPRGNGWRGRWEGGLGWGTHVNPWLFHFNVWQNPPQIKKKMKKKKKESQISKPYTEDKTARSPGDFRLREKGQPVCSWGNGKLVLGLHTLPSVSASPNPTSTDSTRDFHWSLSAFGGLSNPPSERFSNNHSVSVLYCPGAKSP